MSRDVERWTKDASREAWWHQRDPDSPGIFWGPVMVGFTRPATDAEWLAQAFREAVGKAHDYGINEPDDPMLVAVRRMAAEGDAEAQRVLPETKRHINVEDADYNCEHPWCVRWWPMVRAAEALARLVATPVSDDTEGAG